MSAFNPLPDQLQQDSGSPAVDVMRPADQAPTPPPQPAAQPPQQDVSSEPTAPRDPDTGSSTHGWRAVLKGALSGLENHLKGAGEGLVAGGIPGAIVGAVNPQMADTVLRNRGAIQTAQVQTAQAAARSAMDDANFGAQNHDLQLAQSAIHLQQLQAAWDTIPHDFQEKLLQEGAEAGAQLQRSGIQPVFSGSEDDAKAHLTARMRVNSDAPLNVTMLPNANGGFDVYELPSADKTFDHPVDITIGHDQNGEAIKKTYMPGQISIARALNLESAALVDYSKTAAKIQIANQTNVSAKNAAAANKSNAAAASGGTSPTTDSLGVTITPPAGGAKAQSKIQGQFKKDADDLSKTESTYDAFQDALNDINSGKDITGAKSVVTLFNAIGLSATPLKGMGMRINQNTVAEHIDARGVGQSLYGKLLKVQDGDVITPQQIRDYASIASQARESAYVNKINEARSYGLDPSFLLPSGNGRHVDPNTAKIFVSAANGNKDAARKAAQAKGWRF